MTKVAFRAREGVLLLAAILAISWWNLKTLAGLSQSGNAATSAPVSRTEWVDLHYHWEGHANLDEMIARSRAQGIKLGVTGEGGASWGLSNDEKVEHFLGTLQGKPVLRGLQVYGIDWQKRYSRKVLARLDYVAADALLFPDKEGHVIALWAPNVAFPDEQDFMEKYVAYNLKVLSQPINIWSNPTYLPSSLQSRYDQLWTRERMLKVINAAAKNHIAVEINSKYNIPSAAFLKLAKQAGCRFSLGSNRHDDEPGDLEYSIRMAKELGLRQRDMYLPADKH